MCNSVLDWLASWLALEDGVTAMEYAVIGGVIAVVVVFGFTLIGNEVGGAYLALANQMAGS